MFNTVKTTYTQKVYDSRLFELSKESGEVYTQSLIFFHRVLRKKNIFLSEKSISRYIQIKVKRKFLHSQSYQASYQKFTDNLKSFYKAKKEWLKNPSKFSGKPKLTRKRKFFQPIQFKQSAIRFKNNYLELSLAKGLEPLKFKWNITLSIPKFVSIVWNKDKRYWQLNSVIEKEIKQEVLNVNSTLAIDLGVKRIATTFDVTKTSITFSGKKIKSLIVGRNKINAKTQSKLSELKKGSRKYIKIRNANKKVNLRIENKIKDILHKTSRTIVNYAKKKQISKIIIGNCSSIHTGINLGTKNNQQIQQNPEQRLRKYIEYKFRNIGGIVATISENYTSQTCPSCCNKYKPTNRIYKCSNCGFIDDRDVVGAKNIYKVSFGIDIKSKLDVIGFLTKPLGWKYKSNQNCKVNYV